jgi:hypothetical protein
MTELTRRNNLWYVLILRHVQHLSAKEWTSGFTPALLRSFNAANEPDEEFQRSKWSYALAWKV